MKFLISYGLTIFEILSYFKLKSWSIPFWSGLAVAAVADANAALGAVEVGQVGSVEWQRSLAYLGIAWIEYLKYLLDWNWSSAIQ